MCVYITHAMTENVRKKRIDWMVKLLESAEPPILTRKFIATCAYNLGLSTKKIWEYLGLLEDIEAIKMDSEDEEIKWLG